MFFENYLIPKYSLEIMKYLRTKNRLVILRSETTKNLLHE